MADATTHPHYLDITLLGKEYRIACPPEEREALEAAVSYVDEKMHDISDRTKSNIAERIAVMAALNIAHEFLSLSAPSQEIGDNDSGLETGLDFGAVKRRIGLMEAQLDAVLGPQDKLI